MGASIAWPVDLLSNDRAESLRGEKVTASLLSLLGVKPLLGRLFFPHENAAGHDRVVILSEGLWSRTFGADPNVIGRRVRLQDRKGADVYEVVGVMPAAFRFRYAEATHGGARPSRGVDLFVPLAFPTPARVITFTYSVYARLKPGVSLDRARAEMQVLHTRLLREWGRSTSVPNAIVMPLHEATFGSSRPAVFMLTGAVLLVLLMGCVNVATLLLARAHGREQEMAVRAALGSGRIRLLKQLVTENLVLGCMGGTVGVLLAAWGMWALRFVIPAELPRGDEISLDSWVLAFALVVTLVTSLAFGFVPALRSSKPGVMAFLKAGTNTGVGSTGVLRDVLVVVEVAVVVVLTSGGALMINSVWRMLSADLGYRSEHVMTLLLRLSNALGSDGARKLAFDSALLTRVRALPGVEHAATASDLPFSYDGGLAGLYGFKVDFDDQVHFTEAYGIDPAYLSIIHAWPTQGRLLEQSDQSGNPVAVINEAFARRYFPHVSPLGRHVLLKGPLEIVGVVANHRVLVSREGGVKAWLRPAADTQTVRLMEPPALFIPSAYATGTALGGWSYYLVVSTHPPPESLLPAIRREIGALDPNLAVKNIATFDEWMAAPLAAIRFYAIVLAVFAAIGLCLAGVGVYGVLAHTVGRRVSEIGVRMALGATRRRIVRMVLARTLTLVAVGLSSGLLLAWWATNLVRRFLFDVRTTDPLTLTIVVFVLILVAAAASWVPARRATLIQPMQALRCE